MRTELPPLKRLTVLVKHEDYDDVRRFVAQTLEDRRTSLRPLITVYGAIFEEDIVRAEEGRKAP